MTDGGETTGDGAMTGPGAAADRHAARVARWLGALDARHLERLTIAEVRRGLQALSAIYVERRGRHLAAARRGAAVLVVEPVARRALAWWDDWAAVFAAAGGRADTWRFPAELPERIQLLDRAAHLDHRELTGRSLYIAGH